MTHGWKPPSEMFTDTNLGEVYVLDFAFELDVMNYLAKRASRFVWGDHHEDNIKRCPGLEHVEGFRVDRIPATCELTYQWCIEDAKRDPNTVAPSIDPPRVVKYVGDNDTNTHKYPESRPFRSYLYSFAPQVDDYIRMLDDDIDLELYFGKKLLKSEMDRNAAMLKKVAFRAYHQGYPVVCMNRRANAFFFETWPQDDTRAFIVWEQVGARLATVTAYAPHWAPETDLRTLFIDPKFIGHKGACGVVGETVAITTSKDFVVINPKTRSL